MDPTKIEPAIIIPELRFTERMIEAFGEGTHEPFRAMHYTEKIVFGFQAEMMIADWISTVADVGAYKGQQTSFLKPITAGESVRLEAQTLENIRGEQKYKVSVRGVRDDKPRLESVVLYTIGLENGECAGGEKHVVTEEDLSKVHEGLGFPQERHMYPLLLGLASKPLVELAVRTSDLTERLKKEVPVYVGHRIQAYGPIHSIQPGDEVFITPRIIEQRGRDVKAEVGCVSGGRKVYKIEMDLKFIPIALLRRI